MSRQLDEVSQKLKQCEKENNAYRKRVGGLSSIKNLHTRNKTIQWMESQLPTEVEHAMHDIVRRLLLYFGCNDYIDALSGYT